MNDLAEIKAQLDRVEGMLAALMSSPSPRKLSPSAELEIVAARGGSKLEYLKNKYKSDKQRRVKP
jgi:hypothetical protein